jgi:hypothetical protein
MDGWMDRSRDREEERVRVRVVVVVRCCCSAAHQWSVVDQHNTTQAGSFLGRIIIYTK